MAFVALLPVSSFSQNGEEVWKGTCQVCHTEPASGAPQLGDKAAWALTDAQVRAAVDYMISK